MDEDIRQLLNLNDLSDCDMPFFYLDPDEYAIGGVHELASAMHHLRSAKERLPCAVRVP